VRRQGELHCHDGDGDIGSELAHLVWPQSDCDIVKRVPKALQKQVLGTIEWPETNGAFPHGYVREGLQRIGAWRWQASRSGVVHHN
jgi:hypothetical protein